VAAARRHDVKDLALAAEGVRRIEWADRQMPVLAAIVMDISFANQALSAEWVVANGAGLERRVYDVPTEIDQEIARLKLATMGIEIDQLTAEQANYLASWNEGT